MQKAICNILLALLAAGAFFPGGKLLQRKGVKRYRIVAGILGVCSILVSMSVTSLFGPKQIVTITALGEGNKAASGTEITINHIEVNGENIDFPAPIAGQWTLYNNEYRWFEPGDERLAEEETESVTFEFDLEDRVEFVFTGNKWKGIVEIETWDGRHRVDTFRDENTAVRFSLPSAAAQQCLKAAMLSASAFVLSLILLYGAALLAFVLKWNPFHKVLTKCDKYASLRKLLGYQFLFEELVKRDFKKKYKRTVLGMAWSVLSPLLNLLVMSLVFTQFFGRHTPHYTIYLFCGNLVFSYFNESTSQGMTSLMGNASIFTKVNVPKYLFLFSKNVQTLINFGLILCVFFLFCMIDNITFTWKFVCLLYPIFCLVLFNIGVGLILSALFVFFRDIQYLWSVFTQLLMYLSAIFYTIDKYSPMVQNLFLLNPVYLFIRYFRKIVIDATIPSVWFHLLMLADVVIALGVGCWMYKKYNTKFLYYV